MPEVLMPRLSDSMEEGTIIAWLKQDGEDVRVGDAIVEIETDKAIMAYAAEDAGALHITSPDGARVPVGQPIAQIGEAAPTPKAHATASPVSDNGNRVKASPLARRMARELGIGLDELSGTGPRGRIVKADVEARTAAASRRVSSQAPVLPVTAEPNQAGTGPVESLSRLQQTIAERMVRSRREIPDFTVSIDADAAPMLRLRAQLKAVAGPDGVVASLNDMILKAVALVLRDHPRANASYSTAGIALHEHVNVGFAVAAENALLVPVVRDADIKSLAHIARESRALATRAREGKSSADDLDGGTFTISNLGMLGVLEAVPVINAQQAGILGVGAVRTEPVVVDGELTVGQRLRLTIVCDHRILYGADAAELLCAIRSTVEQPLLFAL